VVNDLLEDLQKEGFLVSGYADDTAILVGRNFLDTLRDLMNNTLKTVERWCETKGVAVNPLKTNAMAFTRKYKPEPTEPLRLGGKENFINQFDYILRSLSRP
jgi:Reverse transcriptase (RNA-dependent DNA polymerase).